MSFSERLTGFIFGDAGGLRKKDLSVKRYKFSDVLPYVSYDSAEKFYFLTDNSAGWVYECVPMVFAGGQMASLANIFKQPFPEGSVVQTVLYADPYIEDILDRYNQLRYANPELNEIYKAQAERFADFFRKAAKDGLQQLSRTPIRNFRLYVSVKVPISIKAEVNLSGYKKEAKKIRTDLVDDLEKQLIQSGMSPKAMAPDDFLFVLSRIFNPDIEPKKNRWDESIPLRKQIINGGTLIKRENGAMKFGSMYARCITPKQFPKEIDSFLMNDMLGYFGRGAQSSDDDMNQIKCPFIFTSTFIYEKLNAYIDLRASQVNIQRASGNLASGIVARREEMSWAIDQRDRKGEVFLQAINTLWLFGRDEEVLADNVNRVVSMWTNLNVIPQKELSFILPKLFISSLPLGLYNNDYKDLERHHPVPSLSAAHLMTIQAGCVGLGEPYMLFMERRAQLTSLDILNTGANKNFLMTGGSGGGKSFFLNYLVNSYRSVGAKTRIIDVGKSYEKMANMFDGQFIHFAESNIVLNFFEGIGDIENIEALDDAAPAERERLIREKKEDYADKMFMLTGIIATMAGKTNDPATPEQITLIETAIREVYKIKKNAMEIDDVIGWLSKIEVTDDRHKRLAEVGYYLSLALQKYSSTGEYGYFFHGKSNVSFNNPLAVVELDGVPEDLRKVVVLAFASMIEDEVYNGDRKTPTLVVLDEAWQTLSDNPAAAKFAEGLYRKIRKYNGSVGIATQSVVDTASFGKLGLLGATIRSQSNMHFMLPDKEFETAKREGILNFTEFEWEMLADKLPAKSLPRYSEMIVKSDKFVAAIRLITDTFTYFVCSSDATDNLFINYWRDRFMKEQPDITKGKATVMAIEKAISVCEEIGGIANFKHYVNTKFLIETSAV